MNRLQAKQRALRQLAVVMKPTEVVQKAIRSFVFEPVNAATLKRMGLEISLALNRIGPAEPEERPDYFDVIVDENDPTKVRFLPRANTPAWVDELLLKLARMDSEGML